MIAFRFKIKFQKLFSDTVPGDCFLLKSIVYIIVSIIFLFTFLGRMLYKQTCIWHIKHTQK